MIFRLFWSVVTLLLPWFLRRWMLNRFCGYKIAKSARIGLSLVSSERLIMEENSSIGHFNMIKHVDCLYLCERAIIGNLNWISGIGSNNPKHFSDEEGRLPELTLGRHAAITSRHLIDCSNRVTIGEFSLVAGAGSQILTHAIDIKANRQRSAPVSIGRYCFVGTGAILLKGSALPDFSVLAANSTLHRMQKQSYVIYSGVPATIAAKLSQDALYFHRTTGDVK